MTLTRVAERANPHTIQMVGSVGRRWMFNVAKQIVIDECRLAGRRRGVVTAQLPEQAVEDATQRSLSWPA